MDQIYNYVSDYMEGSLTREQFWVLAKFNYPISESSKNLENNSVKSRSTTTSWKSILQI